MADQPPGQVRQRLAGAARHDDEAGVALLGERPPARRRPVRERATHSIFARRMPGGLGRRERGLEVIGRVWRSDAVPLVAIRRAEVARAISAATSPARVAAGDPSVPNTIRPHMGA